MNQPTTSSVLQITSDYLDAPHLLIVDDEPQKAIDLKNYMERQGCLVTVAFSGQKALEMVYNERPDLVILDLVMPDIGGLAVCQRIKEDASLGYLPVIVVTDNHEERKRLEVGVSGADDYLPKPVNQQDLFLRVLALLRTKRQIDRLIQENQGLDADLKARNEELQRALVELQQAMTTAAQAEMLKKHIIESVDHELRTPMLQIKSAVSILVEVVKELSVDEKNHTVARMAMQAGGRMEELINNISQLHLIEHLKLSPTLLNDAVTQSINSLRRSWSHQHEVSRIVLNDEPMPPVIADRRAVSRILFLLLDNALKFSPEESPVEIQMKQEGDKVWVSVRDQGIGISAEHQQEIFDAFYQVETGSTKRYSGVGVGLALAQMLAEGMSTRIYVESEPGKGSIFYFSLPIADLDRLHRSI